MVTFNDKHPTSQTDFSQTQKGAPSAVRGRRQAPRQRNHGIWYLPVGMESDEGTPLWHAVALWVLGQRRAVTREEISVAFAVAPRRAADVMTYIMRDRSDRVQIHKEVVRVASGHRVAMFTVTAVLACSDSPVIPTQQKCEGPSRPERTTEVREGEQKVLAQALHAFLFQRQILSGLT